MTQMERIKTKLMKMKKNLNIRMNHQIINPQLKLLIQNSEWEFINKSHHYQNYMKQLFSLFIGVATLVAPLAFTDQAFAAPNWDTTGDYEVAFEYQGSDYLHDVSLTQDNAGDLTGNGGSPAGANTYTWVITSGNVDADAISFVADYTNTPDAVTPQTTLDVVGIIAPDGSMSGTWTDNYQGGERAGTWTSISGTATEIEAPVENEMVTVTISKFINGVQATGTTADNADFPMSATWSADNVGAGTGSYTLSETNEIAYQAKTTDMTRGADYMTSEDLEGPVVSAICTEDTPFALKGYSTGDSEAEAMTASTTLEIPTFTDIQNDKYVIVWNTDCSAPSGGIGGEVISGDGTLEVTSIEMVDTTATANGSFESGWEYIFHITAPMSEPDMAMKFSDWLRTGGGGTIPVANNMRISSNQADNGGATILLTAANSYSTPDLHMITDLDPVMEGRQVQIIVEVAVPSGTPDGGYTTSYGVQSNP